MSPEIYYCGLVEHTVHIIIHLYVSNQKLTFGLRRSLKWLKKLTLNL